MTSYKRVEAIIEYFNNQFTDHDDGTFTVGLDIRYATKEDFREFIRANFTQYHQDLMSEVEGLKINAPDGTNCRYRHNQAIDQVLAIIQSK